MDIVYRQLEHYGPAGGGHQCSGFTTAFRRRLRAYTWGRVDVISRQLCGEDGLTMDMGLDYNGG